MPFLGFSKMYSSSLLWLRVRLTGRVAAALPRRSMSSHFSPRSSPSLRPQCNART